MDAVLLPPIMQHIRGEAKSRSRDHQDGQQDVLDAVLRSCHLRATSALSQVKTLVFTGHDTVSSSLAWTYYHLASDPALLRTLRAEHDQVFGTDLAQTDARIFEDVGSLSGLPYTNAVIKETLRMYPPAATTRSTTDQDYMVETDVGQRPLSGCAIWVSPAAMHRHPGKLQANLTWNCRLI